MEEKTASAIYYSMEGIAGSTEGLTLCCVKREERVRIAVDDRRFVSIRGDRRVKTTVNLEQQREDLIVEEAKVNDQHSRSKSWERKGKAWNENFETSGAGRQIYAGVSEAGYRRVICGRSGCRD